MRCLLLTATLVASAFCCAQTIHPHAHAHNDYEHPRPLLDALQNGFRSVEADIYLIEDQLYVSHNRPKPSEFRTLQALYLDPLDSLRGLDAYSTGSMILLVDIKTDGTKTLEKLIEVLKSYNNLSSTDSPNAFVRVVISGNRDYGLILNSGGVSIDGRPSDLGKGYSPDKMPLISDHYGRWMRWNGKGTPSDADIQKVSDLATRVHLENKLLRLWAIPDNEETWRVLLDAGVDLINTDKLEALSAFLAQRKVER